MLDRPNPSSLAALAPLTGDTRCSRHEPAAASPRPSAPRTSGSRTSKAGVPRRRRSDKGWVLALQDGLPTRFTTLVLRRFARDVLGTEFTRSTGTKVVEAAYARSTAVEPGPPAGRAGRRRVTDGAGLRWHFAYEPGERPAVIHLSWEPGCGPQAAAREAGHDGCGGWFGCAVPPASAVPSCRCAPPSHRPHPGR
ncbi:hypothetical protein [Streptomyces sp. NPDC091416]|uniref:hypothetical protein n=1 Tax=Streptomyces sp. NPDC091416 TaxID=3366003 RepID=UPI0038221C5C